MTNFADRWLLWAFLVGSVALTIGLVLGDEWLLVGAAVFALAPLAGFLIGEFNGPKSQRSSRRE